MIEVDKLLKGDRRSLAKAITLIESTRPADQDEAQKLLETILPHSGKSFRLGITGVPGVGKSTFIENFGQYLIDKGHKVAVLAIDPSSPVSGGSILGDKTRMEQLSHNEKAFIPFTFCWFSWRCRSKNTRERSSLRSCRLRFYSH